VHWFIVEYCHDLVVVTIDGFWTGWTGFIDTLYTPLGTTGNYSTIAISTLYSSQLHTPHTSDFSLSHSPLVVSRQRIHNSLTITSNHPWSLICTAWFFSCHYYASSGDTLRSLLQLPTPELNSVLIALGWPPQKTPRPLLLHVDHCCRDLFTVPLCSNEPGVEHCCACSLPRECGYRAVAWQWTVPAFRRRVTI
jgi:hypothetical protein